MKEYNVLEASDLCMNGNPVTYPQSDIITRWDMYFLEALLESHKIRQPCPSFDKEYTNIAECKKKLYESDYDCLSGNYEGLRLRVKKEFSKLWKWLKYWFTPLGQEIDLYEKAQKNYVELKLKAIRDNEIKQAQKLSYVLAKATKETERFGKAINRIHRRKKRYSISTPIIKVNR